MSYFPPLLPPPSSTDSSKQSPSTSASQNHTYQAHSPYIGSPTPTSISNQSLFYPQNPNVIQSTSTAGNMWSMHMPQIYNTGNNHLDLDPTRFHTQMDMMDANTRFQHPPLPPPPLQSNQHPPPPFDMSQLTQPIRPRVSTTYWDDENTYVYQVEVEHPSGTITTVSRREDNKMINGTKLLNVVGLSRGKRDGILKNEQVRVVIKVGAMSLKGVWIEFERAQELAEMHRVASFMHPLFEQDINSYITPSPITYSRSSFIQGFDRSRLTSNSLINRIPTGLVSSNDIGSFGSSLQDSITNNPYDTTAPRASSLRNSMGDFHFSRSRSDSNPIPTQTNFVSDYNYTAAGAGRSSNSSLYGLSILSPPASNTGFSFMSRSPHMMIQPQQQSHSSSNSLLNGIYSQQQNTFSSDLSTSEPFVPPSFLASEDDHQSNDIPDSTQQAHTSHSTSSITPENLSDKTSIRTPISGSMAAIASQSMTSIQSPNLVPSVIDSPSTKRKRQHTQSSYIAENAQISRQRGSSDPSNERQ